MTKVHIKGFEKCEAPLNTGDGFIYNANTRHGAHANPTKSARMMLVISFFLEKNQISLANWI